MGRRLPGPSAGPGPGDGQTAPGVSLRPDVDPRRASRPEVPPGAGPAGGGE